MRFALVLPSWVRDPERVRLADECFRTMLLTDLTGVERPLLVLLTKPTLYKYPIEELRRVFWVHAIPQFADGREMTGCDQPMVYGCEVAFAAGTDFVVHLGDDTLFNREWLRQLQGLIERRPMAMAWSIYRSAHVAVHHPILQAGDDIEVRSINGNGLTVARGEWDAWGVKWQQGPWWASKNGTTLDMHHLSNRLGPRWVTRRSYIEHAGRDGTHAKPHIPEYAIDFVGID